ncbi:hypothetical protein K7432_002441 [Basidiobolus ranarum]|uniref:Major facilitator superfamily (MFS) profile domain-containing protein n=1 Tax=Basidiobolus ranarum TaxID=34480 RepID=A0ABR2X1L0_9FUNG
MSIKSKKGQEAISGTAIMEVQFAKECHNLSESNKGSKSVVTEILTKDIERFGSDISLDVPSNAIYSEYFTTEDEKNLVKKMDWRVLPYAGLIYLFFVLDRGNVGCARLAGIETDLHLSPSQYSMCLSVFYIGYVVCEIPSNLLLKRFSPSRWIAMTMVSWGICTLVTATVRNFQGLAVARLFLGFTEAGLYPGLIFYLTFWYTRNEQSLRFALFTSINSLANAFSGVLSYAVIQLAEYAGLSAWQWIYILEGAPTVLIGVTTWFYMSNTPTDAPWLSEREKALADYRLKKDFRDKLTRTFDKKQFADAFKDPIVLLYMLISFAQVVPLASISLLLPTILRDVGFSNTKALLLSSPPFILATILSISMSYLSDKRHKRSIHVILQPLIGVAGFTMLLFFNNLWMLYAAACVATLGAFSYSAISISWLTNNISGSTKTATATALATATGSLGGIVAGQLYRASEAPHYISSHLINISALSLVSLCAIIMRLYLIQKNSQSPRESNLKQSEKSEMLTFRYTV